MEVLLLRHAEAGEADPKRWPDDSDRPITAEGREKQAAMARAIRKAGLGFEHLVTSPLVRARETADVVAEVFEYHDEPVVSEALKPGAGPEAMVQLLAKFPPDSRVALVGHEPHLSRTAAALIGRSGDASIDLKKSGVMVIEFDGAPSLGSGTLQLLLKPKLVRKLSR
ncbi:MAG TPA: phosphohistidine phosphatase SixA [Gemmatimonadales bacterium]|nr:phosphohistidine phosphatase SixA [Gemmatimonadales bacterium]